MLCIMNIQPPTFDSTARMAIDETLHGFAALSRVQAKQTLDDVSCLKGTDSCGSHKAAIGKLQKVIFKDLLILKVQETLDELFRKDQLPFRLTAYHVKKLGFDEYTVAFYDSRIHSITFTLKTGASFKEVVRAALLQRVARLEKPFVVIESARHKKAAGK
jgi:hypothetical protein